MTCGVSIFMTVSCSSLSPRRSILEFVDFARGMIEDAFGDLDPRIAQDRMDVESYAELLGKLKPAFIHHPESKWHLTAILEDLGRDLEKTYFDVPDAHQQRGGSRFKGAEGKRDRIPGA